MNPSAPAWTPPSNSGDTSGSAYGYNNPPFQGYPWGQLSGGRSWFPRRRGWGRPWFQRGGRNNFERGRSRERNHSTTRVTSRSRSASRRRGHGDEWYSQWQRNPVTSGMVTVTQSGKSKYNLRNPWNYSDKSVESTKLRDWRLPASTEIESVVFNGDSSGGFYRLGLKIDIAPPDGKKISWKPPTDITNGVRDLDLNKDSTDPKKPKKGGLFRRWRSTDAL